MGKKKWTYGPAGDIWKVQEGDIWQAGDHIFVCGDIQKGYGDVLFKKFGRPDIIYVDPPWNQGNIKSFYTKAELNNSQVDFMKFLRKLVSLTRLAENVVYIEMGKQHIKDLAWIVEEQGGKVLNIWEITYYRRKPCFLLRATFNPHVKVSKIDLTGVDDDFTPKYAIEADSKPGDTIADLCTGRGLTARTAHKLGRRFIGTELNPRRLAVVIDWMAKQGLKPKRIGRVR